ALGHVEEQLARVVRPCLVVGHGAEDVEQVSHPGAPWRRPPRRGGTAPCGPGIISIWRGMKAKAGLCAAAAALAWVAAGAHRARPAARTASPGPPFRVRGAPHVHTAFSADATGSVDDVARAARASGLQFVVITDHNSQAALPAAGYREGVLVVCGLEKSTDAGHALVLGTGALPFGLDGDPVEVARDAVRFGGFVVAAHPASPDRELRWSAGWDGIDAIEVLNFGQPGSWPHGAAAVPLIGRYALDPGAALLHGFAFSREALERWDRVLGDRPVAGLLGS